MPVPGAQSTNTGVMIGMTNFNTKKLINGKSVAQIGTGQRWVDVYQWISPYGLAVAGGRYGEVGVGGLLLGGGVSNFGNSHGWSFSTIVGYQVVLADSSIVEVSATSQPDLFWALKGGGNNFAIVTRFDMKTIPITAAFTGITAWAGDVFPQYIKAIADFITPGGGIDDPLTQINPTVAITPPNGTLQALNIPFVAGNTQNPASLANFTAITPNIFNDLGPRANWASGAEELVTFNIIHKRYAVLNAPQVALPTKASQRTLLVTRTEGKTRDRPTRLRDRPLQRKGPARERGRQRRLSGLPTHQQGLAPKSKGRRRRRHRSRSRRRVFRQ